MELYRMSNRRESWLWRLVWRKTFAFVCLNLLWCQTVLVSCFKSSLVWKKGKIKRSKHHCSLFRLVFPCSVVYTKERQKRLMKEGTVDERNQSVWLVNYSESRREDANTHPSICKAKKQEEEEELTRRRHRRTKAKEKDQRSCRASKRTRRAAEKERGCQKGEPARRSEGL